MLKCKDGITFLYAQKEARGRIHQKNTKRTRRPGKKTRNGRNQLSIFRGIQRRKDKSGIPPRKRGAGARPRGSAPKKKKSQGEGSRFKRDTLKVTNVKLEIWARASVMQTAIALDGRYKNKPYPKQRLEKADCANFDKSITNCLLWQKTQHADEKRRKSARHSWTASNLTHLSAGTPWHLRRAGRGERKSAEQGREEGGDLLP